MPVYASGVSSFSRRKRESIANNEIYFGLQQSSAAAEILITMFMYTVFYLEFSIIAILVHLLASNFSKVESVGLHH